MTNNDFHPNKNTLAATIELLEKGLTEARQQRDAAVTSLQEVLDVLEGKDGADDHRGFKRKRARAIVDAARKQGGSNT